MYMTSSLGSAWNSLRCARPRATKATVSGACQRMLTGLTLFPMPSETSASRIVLDAADGAAIVVLGDPKGALQLAARALAATAAGLPLCVGVNHGAVQPAASGRNDDGLIGDGIAVAASVAEFASPSRLLMSRSFRDAMADASPGLESGLFPAGV